MKIVARLFAVLTLLFPATAAAGQQQAPNVVVVQVDDLSAKVLKTTLSDGRPAMPYLQKQLVTGTFLPQTHNTTPLCAPSRATLLSGQFSHNNRVIANSGRHGGWRGWQNSKILRNNLATNLQRAGYYTAHFGKWTNDYDLDSDLPVNVPPGWDAWFSDAQDLSAAGFYGYRQIIKSRRLGLDGQVSARRGNPDYQYDQGIDDRRCRIKVKRGCFYHSDMITRQAIDEIKYSTRPLFLHLDYHAPHADGAPPLGPQPATRHIGLAKNVALPDDPSFNEPDTSDKDYLIQRNNGLIPKGKIAITINSYRSALEAMRSVDQGLAAVSAALRRRGQLDNTYFFFISDNGYFYGEHRFRAGKGLPYRSSATVPTVVWGPKIIKQKYRGDISTADIAPTILSLLGVKSSLRADGRNLSRLLTAGVRPRRRAILSERISANQLSGGRPRQIRPEIVPANRSADEAPDVFYRSLKIGRYQYIDYSQGQKEFYDLRRDPYQLVNQAGKQKFKKHLRYMQAELQRYRDCRGRECRVQPGPPPPPVVRRANDRFPDSSAAVKENLLLRRIVVMIKKFTAQLLQP